MIGMDKEVTAAREYNRAVCCLAISSASSSVRQRTLGLADKESLFPEVNPLYSCLVVLPGALWKATAAINAWFMREPLPGISLQWPPYFTKSWSSATGAFT